MLIPVDSEVITGKFIKYKKIEDSISKIIDNYKYLSFMIEVKKMDHKLDKTAKSIEVRLGEDLEKQGYNANLKAPEVMIYVILLKTYAIVGHIDTRLQKDYKLDFIRWSNLAVGPTIYLSII